jgi:hypothetical protein
MIRRQRLLSHLDKSLKVLIQEIKGIAQSALVSGGETEAVGANYEDVRKAVVKELQRRHSDIPDDCGELND